MSQKRVGRVGVGMRATGRRIEKSLVKATSDECFNEMNYHQIKSRENFLFYVFTCQAAAVDAA